MTLTRKIAGSALVASLALGLAAPASAQWRHHDRGADHLRYQIVQLERDVNRAPISRHGERELDWKVNRLKAKFDQYAYNGINRDEARTLRNMIANVQVALDNKVRQASHRYYAQHDQRFAYNDRYDRRERQYRGW